MEVTVKASFLAEHILEELSKREEPTPTLDFIEVLLTPPPAFYRKAWYYRTFGSLPKKKPFSPSEKQKLYKVLSTLKHAGLIEKKESTAGALWHITQEGLGRLPFLKKRNMYAKESAAYEQGAKDAAVRVISYDIPKKDTRKGYWLREALKRLGFVMIHKSVWVGKRKIPESFLKDLEMRTMLSYVHILEISKTGTLKIKEF